MIGRAIAPMNVLKLKFGLFSIFEGHRSDPNIYILFESISIIKK